MITQPLTQQQKLDITREMIAEVPLQTVGNFALLKIAQLAVKTNSEVTTLTTDATFDDKRYECKMEVTWKLK